MVLEAMKMQTPSFLTRPPHACLACLFEKPRPSSPLDKLVHFFAMPLIYYLEEQRAHKKCCLHSIDQSRCAREAQIVTQQHVVGCSCSRSFKFGRFLVSRYNGTGRGRMKEKCNGTLMILISMAWGHFTSNKKEC